MPAGRLDWLCACLLLMLAASAAVSAAAAAHLTASEPAAAASLAPPASRLPFVPDLPGAAEARAWLASYHEERRRHAAEPPVWPQALRLPSCAELGSKAAAPQGQMSHVRGARPARDARPERHMILATVGDSWGPDASRNR